MSVLSKKDLEELKAKHVQQAEYREAVQEIPLEVLETLAMAVANRPGDNDYQNQRAATGRFLGLVGDGAITATSARGKRGQDLLDLVSVHSGGVSDEIRETRLPGNGKREVPEMLTPKQRLDRLFDNSGDRSRN